MHPLNCQHIISNPEHAFYCLLTPTVGNNMIFFKIFQVRFDRYRIKTKSKNIIVLPKIKINSLHVNHLAKITLPYLKFYFEKTQNSIIFWFYIL